MALRQQAVALDLEMAHRGSAGLAPGRPPRIAGYHFYDFYMPASEVGGDYYDYVELSGGRLAVVLADVSGKGVSAALLMAKLSAEARYCLASEPDPAAAMNRLNASFMHSGWEDRFVTLIFAVLDPIDGTLAIVNAGHPPPLLRRGPGLVEAVGAGRSRGCRWASIRSIATNHFPRSSVPATRSRCLPMASARR